MDYCYHCMAELQGRKACVRCGSCNADITAQPHQLPPGTLLEKRYLLGRVLGAGAFGITYIGMDLRLDRKIAVKEYFPKACANRVSAMSTCVTISSDEDPYFANEGKHKFLQEARVLAGFQKVSGIVGVYDYFEANGTAYIVMEFLEGQTLKEVLKTRRFQSQELFTLMEPVMDALEKIHQQNLIHRDIGPDNIMLTPEGKLVLMDFGAARHYSEEGTKSVTIMVKHGYAPEEQYLEHGETGPWTDIYALCATMHHCLTGVKPQNAIERYRRDQILPPSAYGVRLTTAQESALMKGLAIDGHDRFRSVRELKQALEADEPMEEPAVKVPEETVQVRKPAQKLSIPNQEQKVPLKQPVPRQPEYRRTQQADNQTQNQHTETTAQQRGALAFQPARNPGTASKAAEMSAGTGNPAASSKKHAHKPAILAAAAFVVLLCAVVVVWYAPAHRQELKAVRAAAVGDYITFGTYEQDNDTSNGAEDIEWLVLAKEADRALVISRYALDCQQYNTDSEAVTWETCSLRSWLNADFYNTAFSAAEQSDILTTTVTADRNPHYDTDPGNATEDRVFLLSIDEANRYLLYNDRACAPTAYAEAQRGYVDSWQFCWWWLRSPGVTNAYAASVNGDCKFYYNGDLVNCARYCVRPALWINLES